MSNCKKYQIYCTSDKFPHSSVQSRTGCSRRVLLLIFIAIAGSITAALVCALLVAIRYVTARETMNVQTTICSRATVVKLKETFYAF